MDLTTTCIFRLKLELRISGCITQCGMFYEYFTKFFLILGFSRYFANYKHNR